MENMGRGVEHEISHFAWVSSSFTCTHFIFFFSWVVAQDKFNKYIHFVKTIVGALPPEEVPVDLTDTLQFIKACDMFVAYHHKLDEDDLRDAAKIVTNGYEPCSSMVKVRCMPPPVARQR